MALYTLKNDILEIKVDDFGAELKSIIKTETGKEYMWCGDGKYWNRTSPVLFPFVGKLNNQTYSYNGISYEGVPQHGYARDSKFQMVEQLDDVIWFELRPNEEWFNRYPFNFILRIGYKLEGSKVHVMWTVTNTDDKTMHFSIGAHPAFMCGDEYDENTDIKIGTFIDFNTNKESLTAGIITENGVLGTDTDVIPLENGLLEIKSNTFDKDALILESKDIHTVTLKDNNKKPYLQVLFDTPLVGIWSPVGKKAPFLCIEPWFGRCDREGFDKDLSEREYGNSIDPGHSFNKEYVIEIL